MYDLTQDYPRQTAALRDALATAVTDALDRHGIYEHGDCVTEIESQSRDGFIAHTNGGFRVMVPCTLRDVEHELTDFERETLQDYIDRSRVDACETFIEARPALAAAWLEYDGDADAETWLYAQWDRIEAEYEARYFNESAPELPGMPTAPRFHDSATGRKLDALREELWETLDHWLTEGATFFYEIRAIFYRAGERRNETGSDELYIMSGINTDFEYGRESGLEIARERTYKLPRLTAPRIETIVAGYAAAI